MKQAALRFQPAIQRRAGEWRGDCVAGQIDLCAVNEFDGALENGFVFIIEAVHETGLDADTVVVQTADIFGVAVGCVKVFARTVERVLADGLEADENAFATTARGQF